LTHLVKTGTVKSWKTLRQMNRSKIIWVTTNFQKVTTKAQPKHCSKHSIFQLIRLKPLQTGPNTSFCTSFSPGYSTFTLKTCSRLWNLLIKSAMRSSTQMNQKQTWFPGKLKSLKGNSH
jgi:hypothetical protein